MNRTFQRIATHYRSLFSLHEIENSLVLKLFFGASLLFFFLTFDHWSTFSILSKDAARAGQAMCWPYFQHCDIFYVLHQLPYGYSQSGLFAVLFVLMAGVGWAMVRMQWTLAHFLITLLWIFKTFIVFVGSYTIGGVYDYYHIFLTAILLFIPHKEYFLKCTYVFLYFMSVTMKFDPAWTLGAYFTTLQAGLPLFPHTVTLVVTNIVIASQIVLAWFLLSKHRLVQRSTLVFFLFFHFYSAFLVLYPYPLITIPPLLILFGPLYRYQTPPFDYRALAGWIVIALIALFQLLGFLSPSDRRLTLESNRFGMFMFEANHQCVATVRTVYKMPSKPDLYNETHDFACKGSYCETQDRAYMENGEYVVEKRYESGNAWNRCDPYEWWVLLHQQCALNPSVQHIGFQFDHSINGSPFYRIVDTENMCNLNYEFLKHNDWIMTPPEAAATGYPVKNIFRYSL